MIVDAINSVVIGIISGIVSAAIFHIFLKSTIPKIIISNQIEKRKVKVELDGKVEYLYQYHIKVVNLTRRYVVSVTPYLFMEHRENGPDGNILRQKILNIYKDDIPYIDPYNKHDIESKYAVRIEIAEPLEDIWENSGQSLQLQIYCVDEFSGSGKFFQQTYYQKSCIVEGKFKTGKSLEIDTSCR